MQEWCSSLGPACRCSFKTLRTEGWPACCSSLDRTAACLLWYAGSDMQLPATSDLGWTYHVLHHHITSTFKQRMEGSDFGGPHSVAVLVHLWSVGPPDNDGGWTEFPGHTLDIPYVTVLPCYTCDVTSNLTAAIAGHPP